MEFNLQVLGTHGGFVFIKRQRLNSLFNCTLFVYDSMTVYDSIYQVPLKQSSGKTLLLSIFSTNVCAAVERTDVKKNPPLVT